MLKFSTISVSEWAEMATKLALARGRAFYPS